MAKTVAKTVAKSEVTFKQYGRTLKVFVNGEEFTSTGEKTVIDNIKNLAKTSQEKPIKKNIDALLKALKPATAEKEAKKDKLKTSIKAEKKAAPATRGKESKAKASLSLVDQLKAKIANGEVAEAEMAELQALLPQAKKVEEVKQPKSTSHRKGEY